MMLKKTKKTTTTTTTSTTQLSGGPPATPGLPAELWLDILLRVQPPPTTTTTHHHHHSQCWKNDILDGRYYHDHGYDGDYDGGGVEDHIPKNKKMNGRRGGLDSDTGLATIARVWSSGAIADVVSSHAVTTTTTAGQLQAEDDGLKRRQRRRVAFRPWIALSRTRERAIIPSIVVFGSVSRLLRHVSLMHPFWTCLRWHHLLPLSRRRHPDSTTTTSSSSTSLDQFFLTMAKATDRCRRVRHVLLDFLESPPTLATTLSSLCLSADTILAILSSLDPSQVETVALEMSWSILSDSRIIDHITHSFTHLKRLHIMGSRSRDALYAISSSEIRQMLRPHVPNASATKRRLLKSKPSLMFSSASAPTPPMNSIPPSMNSIRLTHLSLDGFGASNFSWSSLHSILSHASKTLVSVSLSHVRGGIDLTALARTVPYLRSLCISFQNRTAAVSAAATTSHRNTTPDDSDDQDSSDDQHHHQHNLRTEPPTVPFSNNLIPRLKGDLSKFIALESLTMQPHPMCSTRPLCNDTRSSDSTHNKSGPSILTHISDDAIPISRRREPGQARAARPVRLPTQFILFMLSSLLLASSSSSARATPDEQQKRQNGDGTPSLCRLRIQILDAPGFVLDEVVTTITSFHRLKSLELVHCSRDANTGAIIDLLRQDQHQHNDFDDDGDDSGFGEVLESIVSRIIDGLPGLRHLGAPFHNTDGGSDEVVDCVSSFTDRGGLYTVML